MECIQKMNPEQRVIVNNPYKRRKDQIIALYVSLGRKNRDVAKMIASHIQVDLTCPLFDVDNRYYSMIKHNLWFYWRDVKDMYYACNKCFLPRFSRTCIQCGKRNDYVLLQTEVDQTKFIVP